MVTRKEGITATWPLRRRNYRTYFSRTKKKVPENEATLNRIGTDRNRGEGNYGHRFQTCFCVEFKECQREEDWNETTTSQKNARGQARGRSYYRQLGNDQNFMTIDMQFLNVPEITIHDPGYMLSQPSGHFVAYRYYFGHVLYIGYTVQNKRLPRFVCRDARFGTAGERVTLLANEWRPPFREGRPPIREGRPVNRNKHHIMCTNKSEMNDDFFLEIREWWSLWMFQWSIFPNAPFTKTFLCFR